MCYVGMTRAKERLILTYTNTRLLYGQTNANAPSRFVLEIPPELQEIGSEWAGPAELPTTEQSAAQHREELFNLELAPGDEVEHAKFGRGIVGSVNGDEIDVAFPELGTKHLSLSFAPIRKVKD